MPVVMRFEVADLMRCRFAVSPLCETHEAVRTLRRTSRHAFHLPWLRRTRAAVRGLDLADLWLLMPEGGYTPDFLAPPPPGPDSSFDDELDRLRATDPDAAYVEIARSLGSAAPAGGVPARGQAMLADPAAAVRRLADATAAVWRTLIADDWPRLRRVLEADIAYRGRMLADGGLARLLTDLHPDLSWTERALRVGTRHAVRVERSLAGAGLVLMPSVFVWPETVSGFAAPWQPALIYPVRGMDGLWHSAAPAAGTVARLLGAHRAALLADLGEPAATTELARRHGLAPSSVSAHLSLLYDAGLLHRHRAGRRVLYQRTALGTALLG